jgi:4-hydroxymandelate oxidase
VATAAGVPLTDGGSVAYLERLSWTDIEWLADFGLPVIVKGILHPDDARLAVEHRAAGVQVSNHGGRQLDAAIASLDALPRIVEAVEGRVPVLLDGGVRRGSDIVTAVAMGATAVGIGRPAIWGLAVDGEAGVGAILDGLANEFDLAMAFCGAAKVAELTPELLA